MKEQFLKTIFMMMLNLIMIGYVIAGGAQTMFASPTIQGNDTKVTILTTDSTLSTLPLHTTSKGDTKYIRIGVLARRGQQQCIEQWEPTAVYLTQEIPGYSFSIVPLDFNHILDAVSKQEVDFILANSSFYVELEVRFGVTRIVTLNNLHSDGTPYAVFAGVIFTRSDRVDINNLNDLRGKSIMAADEKSLGGWHMEWREMKALGVDPYQDFKKLTFGGTHDAVIYAVRDGTVDAGCVRSNTLERMELEGKINLAQFKLIMTHDSCDGNIRYLHSTRHYPEWPLAKSKHTDEALAKQVVVALMRLTPTSPAAVAGNYAGWTIPQNYQPVHECLMELNLSPYQDYGKVTFGDFWRQYWPWLLGILTLLILIAAGAIYASQLQVHLKHSELAQKEREQAQAFLQTVIDGFPESLMVINNDYTIALANRAVINIASARDLVENCLKCYQVSHNHDQPCSGENHPCPFDRVFKTKRPVIQEHIHYDNSGKEKIVELIAAPIFDEMGNVVKIIESCRDITERKQVEEKIVKNLAINQALSSLYVPIITPNASIEQIADIILEKSRQLTKSVHGYVAEIDMNNGDMIAHTNTKMIQTECTIAKEEHRKVRFPQRADGLYNGLWGQVLNTKVPFYTNEPGKHQASVGVPEGHIVIERFLSVPVMLVGELVGQIALANSTRVYTEQDLDAVNSVAEFYALAIQRKRAETELQKQMDEISRFNKLMIGREEKMIELKKEINSLLTMNGKPAKYTDD